MLSIPSFGLGQLPFQMSVERCTFQFPLLGLMEFLKERLEFTTLSIPSFGLEAFYNTLSNLAIDFQFPLLGLTSILYSSSFYAKKYTFNSLFWACWGWWFHHISIAGFFQFPLLGLLRYDVSDKLIEKVFQFPLLGLTGYGGPWGIYICTFNSLFWAWIAWRGKWCNTLAPSFNSLFWACSKYQNDTSRINVSFNSLFWACRATQARLYLYLHNFQFPLLGLKGSN